MSSTLQRTLLLDYSLILTGIRTRRQLLADRSGILINSDFEHRELTLAATEQVAIAGIEQFFLIKADGSLQLNLNNTGFFVVTDLFVTTSAISNLTIFNASATDAIHCVVIYI